MGSVKTAISLDAALFAEADALARELGTSRSQLVAQALAAFIEDRKARLLRQQLDAVYGDESADREPGDTNARRLSHRRLVEGTW